MPELLQTVALDRLQESKTNPRRHFSEKGLAELAASIGDHGVLNPLLVRTIGKNGKLEIICGHRRFRAAQAAGVDQVPVRMVTMTDDQVLEIQVVENLQREDVHPLDEAEGYRALMKTGRYTVEDLAAKVGKSASYVYQRLKLGELIEPAKKAFWSDKITAGHAILIARLQPNDQKAVMESYLMQPRGDQGVASVREIAAFIQREILLDLAKATFDVANAGLVGHAPACADCPKRTGAQRALWDDVAKGDHCTDPACWHSKEQATVNARLEDLIKAGESPLKVETGWRAYHDKRPADVLAEGDYELIKPGVKHCDHLRKAVVVCGEGIGKVVTICPNRKCRVHGYVAHSGGATNRDGLRQQRERLRQERESYRRAREAALGTAMAEPRAAGAHHRMQLIARALIHRLEHDDCKQIVAELGIECPKQEWGGIDAKGGLQTYAMGLGGVELARLLVNIALRVHEPDTGLYYTQPSERNRDYARLVAEFGVDLAEIEAEVKAEAKAADAAKAAKKAKTEPKKRAATSKKKTMKRAATAPKADS